LLVTSPAGCPSRAARSAYSERREQAASRRSLHRNDRTVCAEYAAALPADIRVIDARFTLRGTLRRALLTRPRQRAPIRTSAPLPIQ
jgi:hypothetical protein